MIPATQLADRELTYNGVSIVDPKMFDQPHQIVLDLLKVGAIVRATEITKAIDQYNQLVSSPVMQPVATDFIVPPPNFVLPASYGQLNVQKYVEDLLAADIERLSPASQQAYVIRYKQEINWFIAHEKLDVLRTMVYIVDTLEANNIPWGVGRGSSVSSYILYLIGVHDINPIKYRLDWREFLRDEDSK